MSSTQFPPDERHPGTESERYAGVVVPASRLTVEGEIQAFADIARTAKRGTGWRRRLSFVVAAIVLAPFAVAVIIGLVSACKLL